MRTWFLVSCSNKLGMLRVVLPLVRMVASVVMFFENPGAYHLRMRGLPW